MRLLNLRDDDSTTEEYGGGNNKNRRIHHEGRIEREPRVDQVVPACIPLPFVALIHRPGLHKGGMQIEVVRHDGRPDDADGDKETFYGQLRNKTGRNIPPFGPGKDQLQKEANTYRAHKHEDKCLEFADAVVLDEKEEESVQTRHKHADQQRKMEKKVESDGGAENLREVASTDGTLAEDPQRITDRFRVMVAACLSKISA